MKRYIFRALFLLGLLTVFSGVNLLEYTDITFSSAAAISGTGGLMMMVGAKKGNLYIMKGEIR